jgi:hypothetical protein
MLKFDRPEWLPLRDTMNAYLGALARILSAAPRVRRMRAEDRLMLARALFGAVSGVTSVQTTSETRPRRQPGLRALVSSLVAMALRYVDSSDLSRPRPRPTARGARGARSSEG